MTINDIIVMVLKDTVNEEGKKIKQVEVRDRIARNFGTELSQQAFSDRLRNKNMKINSAIEILDVLGYEIVARPKKGSRQEYVAERGEGRSE